MKKKPLVFTGAGISVGSGLPTFAGATWRGRSMRDFLHIDYLQRDPSGFMELYREAFTPWFEAQPSRAHLLVAAAGYPVVTQNIDHLHQKAGSKDVVELHGSIYRLYCTDCSLKRDVAIHPELIAANTPLCPDCHGHLRPDIVLFGEMIHNWEHAVALLENASRLIVVGTSLTVYPAALLERMARNLGLRVDIVNDDADNKLADVL